MSDDVKPYTREELDRPSGFARAASVTDYIGAAIETLSAYPHLQDAVRRLEATARAGIEDRERLDDLDAAIKDESPWTDLALCHDHEDGVWIRRIERGQLPAGGALDHSPEPLRDVREAIDASVRTRSGRAAANVEVK